MIFITKQLDCIMVGFDTDYLFADQLKWSHKPELDHALGKVAFNPTHYSKLRMQLSDPKLDLEHKAHSERIKYLRILHLFSELTL